MTEVTERIMKMPNYNYNYYEHISEEAFVAHDEGRREEVQLYMLDTIARSLACIADVLEKVTGNSAPKEVDYLYDLVKDDDDDNG